MNLVQHILLAVYWLLFGVLHSILATKKIKNIIKPLFGNSFKYYRLCYSFIATITLVYILYYHFSLNSFILWQAPVIEKIIAVIAASAGFVIMVICARKYFFDLSGIDALLKRENVIHLQTGGFNRYVRHPLYSGTLLFVWSFFLWQPSLANLISSTCITLYTIAGARFEEKKLLEIFGVQYRDYALRVPLLIPKLFIAR